MTDDEFDELARLLEKYCNEDLDQFDDWMLTSQHGPVFLSFTRELPTSDDIIGYKMLIPPMTEEEKRAWEAVGARFSPSWFWRHVGVRFSRVKNLRSGTWITRWKGNENKWL